MALEATSISENQKSDVSESRNKSFLSHIDSIREATFNSILSLIRIYSAEKEPKVKEEYVEKLKRIRKGKFIKIKGSLLDRY